MEAGQVAEEGYRGFLRGKTLIMPGVRNRFIAFLPRLLPHVMITRLVRSFSQDRTEH